MKNVMGILIDISLGYNLISLYFGRLSMIVVLILEVDCSFISSICSLLDEGNGEGNDTPLQYSCLENPMDGGAWKAAVHGVTEGRT